MMTNSAFDLRYRLIYGPACLEPLRVLASRAVPWRGWTVNFHVLGASHAVRLVRGRASWTELLTCLPPAGDHCVAFESGLAAEDGSTFEAAVSAPPFVWRVRAAIVDGAGADKLVAAYPLERRLEMAYPSAIGRAGGTVTPVTHVGWCCEADRVAVETLHTYPEESTCVRTWSDIMLIEEDAEWIPPAQA